MFYCQTIKCNSLFAAGNGKPLLPCGQGPDLWITVMRITDASFLLLPGPALVSAFTTSAVLVYPLLSLSAVSWDRVGWARLSTGEEKRNRSRIFLYRILWETQFLRKIRVSTCSCFCLYVPKAGHLPLQHSSACHLAVSSARTQLLSWRTERSLRHAGIYPSKRFPIPLWSQPFPQNI